MATDTQIEHEVERGGHVHVVQLHARHDSGVAVLKVRFWGRDAWLPACTVLGHGDDSRDVAIGRGVDASEDYCAQLAAIVQAADAQREDCPADDCRTS